MKNLQYILLVIFISIRCDCNTLEEEQIILSKKNLQFKQTDEKQTEDDKDKDEEKIDPNEAYLINHPYIKNLKIKTDEQDRQDVIKNYNNLHGENPKIDLLSLSDEDYKKYIRQYYWKSLTCANTKFTLQNNKVFFISMFGKDGLNTSTRHMNKLGYGERTYADTLTIWEKHTQHPIDLWVWNKEEVAQAEKTRPKESKFNIRSIEEEFFKLENDEFLKQNLKDSFSYFTMQRLINKINESYKYLDDNKSYKTKCKYIKYIILDIMRILIFYIENKANKDLILTYSDFTNNPNKTVGDFAASSLSGTQIITSLKNLTFASQENGLIIYNQKSTNKIFKDDDNDNYIIQLFPILELMLDKNINSKYYDEQKKVGSETQEIINIFLSRNNITLSPIQQEKIIKNTNELRVYNNEKLLKNGMDVFCALTSKISPKDKNSARVYVENIRKSFHSASELGDDAE